MARVHLVPRRLDHHLPLHQRRRARGPRAVCPGHLLGGRDAQPHVELYVRRSVLPPDRVRIRCGFGRQRGDLDHTGDHPTRPPGLPHESLSLETVYRRAGFDVTKSGARQRGATGRGRRGRALEQPGDARRDAGVLVAFRAQAAVVACGSSLPSLHEMGTEPRRHHVRRHRSQPAPGHGHLRQLVHRPGAGKAIPNPAAWVSRMRFWTAAHEMGHAFNLAHAWQKSLGTPWIPLNDEPGGASHS